MKPGDIIRIEWDKIPGPRCITVNDEPLNLVASAKIEWPGEVGNYGPALLTIQQHILGADRRSVEPAQHVTQGYLVPKERYDAFARWELEQRRAAGSES